MKYDLTSNLIFLIPVIKVDYINNYKSIINFMLMVLFLVCQGMCSLGGLIDMIR